MTETSDDGWTDWIPHDGGPCPIPWAEEGDLQVRFADGIEERGAFSASFWQHDGDDFWRHESDDPDCAIVAYRVRADLAHRLAPAESKNLLPRDWLKRELAAARTKERQPTNWFTQPDDDPAEAQPPGTTPARPIAEAAEEMARALEPFAAIAGNVDMTGGQPKGIYSAAAAALAAYRAAKGGA